MLYIIFVRFVRISLGNQVHKRSYFKIKVCLSLIMLHNLHADIFDYNLFLILPSQHCITIGLLFLCVFFFFFFPILLQIGMCVFLGVFLVCFFLSPEKFTCHSFIRFQSCFFFFPAPEKKKQLFHSFVRICQKTHKNDLIPVKKKIRYLWLKILLKRLRSLDTNCTINFEESYLVPRYRRLTLKSRTLRSPPLSTTR